MSTPTPGGGNPFEGMPIFSDLARLFTGQGPINWEVARQIAAWIATEGRPEANVDPSARMRIEELARVAELHVADATGMPVSVTGHPVTVRTVSRSEWALTTLTAFGPLLERLASSLAALSHGSPGGDDARDDDPGDAGRGFDPMPDLLGNLTQLMAPMLLGMQSGFMVGYLARRSLGQYDLPIPRPPSDELHVVGPNLEEFATDWSVDLDDLRMWVCLHLLTHHSVLSRPHVRARLDNLLSEYVGGFQSDPSAIESRMGDIDPGDPSSWERLFGDPETLLGTIQTDAQRQVLATVEAVVAALEGYVDHVMDGVARKLVARPDTLAEAFRRRRVERGEGDRFVERLFGLELDQRVYDRGTAFVQGVVERAGEAALVRLWASERELPTPSEIDAPGLWLARIDLVD